MDDGLSSISTLQRKTLCCPIIYDSKASSDAAQENAAAVMAGGSEFFTGNAVLLEGDLVWSGRPNS